MDTSLRSHLHYLNLSEYIQVLEANGYNDWTEVMKISEHNLGRLGFKLGHRRRLQREIASAQGYPPSKALPRYITEPDQIICTVPISHLSISIQESSTLVVDEPSTQESFDVPMQVLKRARSRSMESSDEKKSQAIYLKTSKISVKTTKKHKKTPKPLNLNTVFDTMRKL